MVGEMTTNNRSSCVLLPTRLQNYIELVFVLTLEGRPVVYLALSVDWAFLSGPFSYLSQTIGLPT